MSEFLKKFKSVFVLEDEAAADQSAAKGSQHPAEMSAPPPKSAASASVAEPERGTVSNKFVEVLAAALEKNNQQGFDYFEFRQALRNLAKMPMDEATRFHSAYAMAQTMGVTPEKLVESAKFYLDVLAKEQAKFSEAHAQQQDEHHHLHEAEQAQVAEDERPGVQEGRVHVEQDEDHADQVELDREALAGRADGRHATLVRGVLRLARPRLAEEVRERDDQGAEGDGETEEEQDGSVGRQHLLCRQRLPPLVGACLARRKNRLTLPRARG